MRIDLIRRIFKGQDFLPIDARELGAAGKKTCATTAKCWSWPTHLRQFSFVRKYSCATTLPLHHLWNCQRRRGCDVLSVTCNQTSRVAGVAACLGNWTRSCRLNLRPTGKLASHTSPPTVTSKSKEKDPVRSELHRAGMPGGDNDSIALEEAKPLIEGSNAIFDGEGLMP